MSTYTFVKIASFKIRRKYLLPNNRQAASRGNVSIRWFLLKCCLASPWGNLAVSMQLLHFYPQKGLKLASHPSWLPEATRWLNSCPGGRRFWIISVIFMLLFLFPSQSPACCCSPLLLVALRGACVRGGEWGRWLSRGAAALRPGRSQAAPLECQSSHRLSVTEQIFIRHVWDLTWPWKHTLRELHLGDFEFFWYRLKLAWSAHLCCAASCLCLWYFCYANCYLTWRIPWCT